jgi:DNA-binding NarL/FixJ family response regulator
MRVAICERSGLFRESLARVVTDHGHELVCAAADPARVDAEVRHRGADVILADAGSAHALAELGAADPCRPEPQVLVLATVDGTESAQALLRAGLAAAVLDHGTALRTLQRALRGQVPARSPRRHPGTVVRPREQALTKREAEVLEHLVHGRGTDAIAATMAVSRSTVQSHVQNVLRKLGARNRVEAVTIYLARRADSLPATA